ncbi:ADAMTS-like protein 1 isoform 2 precursor [Camelus ferus]|nr:ADAMTS-like protein 1 isoform 2 precursor [Camelus ferus]
MRPEEPVRDFKKARGKEKEKTSLRYGENVVVKRFTAADVFDPRCGMQTTSRNARSDEEKDSNWDAWGDWSDCSRTCGGGASYSLRRCLTGRNCEGQNIRYKTCSNHGTPPSRCAKYLQLRYSSPAADQTWDCPPDAEDFRAQQCSAYNDVQYQGRYYEWLPRYNDPAAPCALKCHARGQNLVVELAPKVLDGTRCNADSLDMCISGICQAVGCNRQLGSNAKEDNCGVCAGDGSTCRLEHIHSDTVSLMLYPNLEARVSACPSPAKFDHLSKKMDVRLVFPSSQIAFPDSDPRSPPSLCSQTKLGPLCSGRALELLQLLQWQREIRQRKTAQHSSEWVAASWCHITLLCFISIPFLSWKQSEVLVLLCALFEMAGEPLNTIIESKTLQGSKGEHSFNSPGVFVVENTTVEFQRGSGRQTFKIPGPLMADFIFKTRSTAAEDSVVQFFFYQPISHQWRQTDFFPCTVTCGGGYQLNSAECVDIRLKRVVPDHYCHYYPENVKPKPKLKECSMDPCPSRFA